MKQLKNHRGDVFTMININTNKVEYDKKLHNRMRIQKDKIFINHTQLKRDRPILDNVHYNKNGNIEVTNSRVAIRIRDSHEMPSKHKDNYPSLEHIFNGIKDTLPITLNKRTSKILENQLNVLYTNKIDTVDFIISDNQLIIQSIDDKSPFISSRLKITNEHKETIQFRISTRYLHDALMFFRQLKIDTITLNKSINQLQPLLITALNIDYLVMPIRP